VVARHEHDLAVGAERVPDRAQYGPRGLERIVHRAVAQLERVAEHDQPVDAVQGAHEGRLRGGATQDVDARAGTEVEV